MYHRRCRRKFPDVISFENQVTLYTISSFIIPIQINVKGILIKVIYCISILFNIPFFMENVLSFVGNWRLIVPLTFQICFLLFSVGGSIMLIEVDLDSTVYNRERMSNVLVVILSSYLSKLTIEYS